MIEKELLQQLQAAFRSEAGERLASLGTHLLDLEKEALSAEDRSAAIETIFREMHSLKGAARAVNFPAVESLCQESESVLALVKRGKQPLDAPLFDTLHRVTELIGSLIDADLHGRPASFAGEIAAITGTLRTIGEKALKQTEGSDPSSGHAEAGGRNPTAVAPSPADINPSAEAPLPEAPVPGAPSPATEHATTATVRVAMEKLDGLLLQAEEMVALKLVGRHQLMLVESLKRSIDRWQRRSRDIAGEIRALHHKRRVARADTTELSQKVITKIIDFFDWQQTLQQELGQEMQAIRRSVRQGQYLLEPSVDALLDDMKRVIMLPFATVYDPLPMMARSIARQQKKQVRLVLRGGDIEIDRRILDEMKDPLIHLIRNAIDHGVEPPAVREAAGKPAEATIEVAVDGREDGTVHIRVTDNGCGIDIHKVRQKLTEQGDLTAAEAEGMEEADLLQQIFRSGVTTTPMVTDISGRGIGLAIVKEKVVKLGGQVEVDTVDGKGTSFAMRLPVTLASFRGVLVKAGATLFVIPSAQVEGVLRLKPEAIKSVENRTTIPHKGKVVSLVVLADLLKVQHRPRLRAEDSVHVVVLAAHERRIAFQVNEVLGEQEFLVKGLGPQLSRVRNIAGGTVLGSGLLAPVLNVQDLLASAVSVPGAAAAGPVEGDEASGKRTVLVVEDSITSRMLIKNILQGAGYAVITAVDGVDALTQLATERVELVVTDVEMPRLDGFALTAKIRAEPRLAELPVILLTGLETRDDRERGIEVGANAYLVKSGFDQSNLLEVVARFLA
jgi:two-component system chemotaxis sensor kinase CheA